MNAPKRIAYSTSNPFKIEEAKRIIAAAEMDFGSLRKRVGDHFEFAFFRVPTGEPMKCSIADVVREKVKTTYAQLLVPCIVEYAGLVFEDCAAENFPGGLTQSIWNALGVDRFVNTFAVPGRRTFARAGVGYCDGKNIRTFIADTAGCIADAPHGTRPYDWDTIFCPDGEGGQTYAQISEDPQKGIDYKVRISQSTKAMLELFSFITNDTQSDFFY